MKFFMIFLAMAIFVSSTNSRAALRVTIDPGHGGEDKGAFHGGIKESDVVLKISKKLNRLLKKDPLFDSQLLRRSDKELSLEQRVRMAKKFKTQLFLSIHANAHTNQRARGAEFYIQNQLPMDEESLQLAHIEHKNLQNKTSRPTDDVEAILYDLKKSQRILKSFEVSRYFQKNWPQKKQRPIRQGPFFVLSQNTTPAILVEVGYLTHPKERRRLKNRAYQFNIARKIHSALRDYVKDMDKTPSPILQPQDAKTR